MRGKLAGSVFQRSNGGVQLRSKVSPRNTNTAAQQNIRRIMSTLSTSWGELSEDQRRSWFNNAGLSPLGFPLYMRRNEALLQAGLPIIDTFIRGTPPLNLLQEPIGHVGDPFGIAILVNVDAAPPGYTQVNKWSKWVPPSHSFVTRTRYNLDPANFQWDADASAYAFDPSAPDYPPAAGWHAVMAYGAVENASGVLSISNYLAFTAI